MIKIFFIKINNNLPNVFYLYKIERIVYRNRSQCVPKKVFTDSNYTEVQLYTEKIYKGIF